MKICPAAASRLFSGFFARLLLALLASGTAARADYVAVSFVHLWTSTTRDFSDVLLPGENILIDFNAGTTGGVPESGVATLTIPPEIVIHSWAYRNGRVESVEVNGQVVTVNVAEDGSLGDDGRSRFDITLSCSTKSIVDLPETARLLEFPVTVSMTDSSLGTATQTKTYEGQMAYSRLSVTADKSGPVKPGDIITYSINASAYPLEKFVSSRLTLQQAYATDIVAGSLTGTGGGTVTGSGQFVIDWTSNPGSVSASYQVKVRESWQIPPSVVEVENAGVHYRLVVERPEGGSRRTHNTAAPKLILPLDRGANEVTLEIDAPTEGLEIDEPFEATVTVSAQTSDPLTIAFPDGLLSSSDSEVFETDPPTVPAFTLDALNTERAFTVTVTPRDTGVANLLSRVSVDEGQSPTVYVSAEREVEVPSDADLQIREAGETPGEWRGNDFYRKTPAGPQLLEKSIALDGEYAFDVRVENDGDTDQVFVLKASETFGDDWDMVYVADGIGDVTTAIKSAAGISINLAPSASRDVQVSLAPTLDTFSGQKSITLTVYDEDSPGKPRDSVEAIVKRSEILLEIDPAYPLVGHVAEVAVKLRNATGAALSEVKPIFIVDDPDPFDPGATVELLAEESDPPSVASLADGAEATFVFRYRIKSEGGVRFKAEVGATTAGGDPYESPTGELDVQVGKVAIESFELVQTLPDKPFIAGKRAGMLVTLSNTSPIKQTLGWTTDISGGYARSYAVADGLELAPGESEHLLPMSDIAGDKFVTIKGSAANWELKLFGADESVEDYDGRSADLEQDDPKLIFVNIEPAVAVFPSWVQAGISVALAESITQKSIAYMNAALPMAGVSGSSPQPISIPAQPGSIVAERNYNLVGLGRFVERASIFSSVTRIVLLSPDDDRFWAPGVDGIVLENLDRVALLRARPGLADGSAAHEIAHSYGQLHYTGNDLVAKGYRIGPDKGEILKDMPDLMRPKAGADMWISDSVYDFMMGAMSGNPADPEMVVISGAIDGSDVVTADPWYTVWTDQVTTLSDEGAYSVATLDAEGTTLSEHRFDPSFEMEVILSADATEEPDLSLSASPFVFSMPRHKDLHTIRILKGATVLYEREVSPNAPSVEIVTQLEGATLEAGDATRIAWTASDPDGGALIASLEWSADAGASWTTIAIDHPESAFDWSTPDRSTRSGWIRLRVSDGLNTTTVLEGPFAIVGTEPELIVDVGGSAVIPLDAPAGLDASGSYASDGAALTYSWRAFLFPGDTPPVLDAPAAAATAWTPSGPGEYIFELLVSDSAGRAATAYKMVTVSEDATHVAGVDLSIRSLPGGRFELRWPDGLFVDLLRSSDLSPDSWIAILSGARSENGDRVLSLDEPALRQFFRLRAK